MNGEVAQMVAEMVSGEAVGRVVFDQLVEGGSKELDGSGGSLEPPGPLLTHPHTVYTVYSECIPTRLSALAERASYSPRSRVRAAPRSSTAWPSSESRGRG
jgi:hypothetical protein